MRAQSSDRQKRGADRPRYDLIEFIEDIDTPELDKGLVIGKTISLTTTHALRALIVKYWDCFCDRGIRRTSLDYEFAIDTVVSPSVCCRKPTHGLHEHPFIMAQVDSLLNND